MKHLKVTPLPTIIHRHDRRNVRMSLCLRHSGPQRNMMQYKKHRTMAGKSNPTATINSSVEAAADVHEVHLKP
jgi:hypothetical protein